jgi:hypothetical protein
VVNVSKCRAVVNPQLASDGLRSPLDTARFPTGLRTLSGTLAKLRRLLPDKHPRLWVFANRVLEDAECARAWRAAAAPKPPALDPYEAKRREDAEYLDSLGPQITAARAGPAD